MIKNQIVGYKDFAFGIQPHFEFTKEYLNKLIDEDDDLIQKNKQTLIRDFESIKEEYFSNQENSFYQLYQYDSISKDLLYWRLFKTSEGDFKYGKPRTL